MNAPTLDIDARIRWSRGTARVEGWVGRAVRIRPETNGPVELVSVQALLGDPQFEVIDEFGQPHELSQKHYFRLDGVPDTLVKEAVELRGHIWEAVTGFRFGSRALQLPGEPRDEYNRHKDRNKKNRLKTKAQELGMGWSTLRRHEQGLRSDGLAALIDERRLPHKKRLRQYDPDVIEFIRQGLLDQRRRSNKNYLVLRDEINIALAREFPGRADVELSTQAFNRLVLDMGLSGWLKERPRVRAARLGAPPTPYGVQRARRPGEAILIDENDLDIFALDPLDHKWIRVSMLLAMDLCTRSLVGWRFAPVKSDRLDAALLLHDIVMPKPMRPGWPAPARFAYVGVPEQIHLQIAEESGAERLAGVPFPKPERVIADHAWIFKSNAFLQGCQHLDIDLVPARKHTPEDKAALERAFKSINGMLWQRLSGYKGRDIPSRGVDVEQEAFYTLDELEAIFARFVATHWQRRPHKGLRMDTIPRWRMSPNVAYNEAIARCGFVHLPPSRNLFYELLPADDRTIQNDGVEWDGFQYDAPQIKPLRKQRNPDHAKGLWRFRRDPRDLTRIYFDLPGTGWITLDWRHMPSGLRPFTQEEAAFAKDYFVQRNGRRPDPKELASVLLEITRNDLEATRGTSQRARARAASMRRAQLESERADQTEPAATPAQQNGNTSSKKSGRGSRNGKPATAAAKPVTREWGEVD